MLPSRFTYPIGSYVIENMKKKTGESLDNAKLAMKAFLEHAPTIKNALLFMTD
jgi:hypothetical protein